MVVEKGSKAKGKASKAKGKKRKPEEEEEEEEEYEPSSPVAKKKTAKRVSKGEEEGGGSGSGKKRARASGPSVDESAAGLSKLQRLYLKFYDLKTKDQYLLLQLNHLGPPKGAKKETMAWQLAYGALIGVPPGPCPKDGKGRLKPKVKTLGQEIDVKNVKYYCPGFFDEEQDPPAQKFCNKHYTPEELGVVPFKMLEDVTEKDLQSLEEEKMKRKEEHEALKAKKLGLGEGGFYEGEGKEDAAAVGGAGEYAGFVSEEGMGMGMSGAPAATATAATAEPTVTPSQKEKERGVEEEPSTTHAAARPVCEDDASDEGCTRTNAVHFKVFAHPSREGKEAKGKGRMSEKTESKTREKGEGKMQEV